MPILKATLFVAALLAATTIVNSQAFSVDDVPLINGYSKTIQGEVLPYFSLYKKYAKEALLTRCTDGKKAIEWETDTIPANTKGKYAYFTWISAHSSGTSSGIRNFDLYLNDEPVLTFSTQPKQYPPYWNYSNADSTCIMFSFKKKDAANDAHGMAYLRVPLSKYKPGLPLRIKVVGQAQQSNDWFMTFRYSFKEKIEITALPFLLNNGKQLLQVTVLHFGPPNQLNIAIGGVGKSKHAVKNGFNSFDLEVPAVKQKQTLDITASVGNLLTETKKQGLRPVIYRELNLVHHSHTDIGYSHIQEEVIQIHNKNIRDALLLAEKTKNYPLGSRFIWHIESAWAVENFLNEATEKERSQFFAAVKAGQIVISALYSNNLTGLAMPEELDWVSGYSYNLGQKHGLPIKTAMMTDVPGMSWSMVSSLAAKGVRYFSNGMNYIEPMPGHGDRVGHALENLGDKPFWWKSPSGKDSILMWCGAKGYSAWHGTAIGAVFETGPEKIAGYLDELDANQYPFEMVHWRYNIVADNGPVDSSISDFIVQWNQKYKSPKLVLANAIDMFERFEKLYGKKIPVLSGDFTPYWEDGAYSTAKEEGANRLAAQKIIAIEHMAWLKNIGLDQKLLYNAKRNVILFHEHTWGAHNSISQPDIPFVTHQWDYKKRFGDSALYYTSILEEELMRGLHSSSDITVLNPKAFASTGFVETKCPPAFTGNMLKDENGRDVLVQRLANGNIGFIAHNVPANGEKRYSISKEDKRDSAAGFLFDFTVNNSGAINRLQCNGIQWADTASFKGILQLLYVDGLNPSNYMEGKLLSAQWVDDGPIVKTLQLTVDLPGTNGAQYFISSYAGLDYLKVGITIDKKEIRGKESLHIALPFKLNEPQVRIGAGNGIYGPDYMQLPGSNKEFFYVQRWLNVSGNQGSVTVTCPQGALFEVGQMIDEQKDANGYKQWKNSQPSSATIFLYAMNNYWHTNFKAGQEGKATFDVYLKFQPQGFLSSDAEQFGNECTTPFMVLQGKNQ